MPPAVCAKFAEIIIATRKRNRELHPKADRSDPRTDLPEVHFVSSVAIETAANIDEFRIISKSYGDFLSFFAEIESFPICGTVLSMHSHVETGGERRLICPLPFGTMDSVRSHSCHDVNIQRIKHIAIEIFYLKPCRFSCRSLVFLRSVFISLGGQPNLPVMLFRSSSTTRSLSTTSASGKCSLI